MKPVSRTAYYCCAVRALDARAASPVCGDTFADRFMTPEAWKTFEPFRGFGPPNASNVARHRMIDDVLRARLAARPDSGVVIIGAGFDTRAFRLAGGHWVELDEPAVLELKEARLPAREAPNPLTRVAIEFDREPLVGALAPFHDLTDPMVVIEGVWPYLTEVEISAVARTVRGAWANPTLVCDLMTATFTRRYGGRIGRQIQELGATWRPFDGEALPLIEAAGFRLASRESVVSYAAARGTLRAPRWLLATLLRTLRDGYSIATFRAV
jgi:methyltransferase (TIGR00027 family)